MKKKALIFSGINWNSTKQRHHDMADILVSINYDVTFVQGVKSSDFSLSSIFRLLRAFVKDKSHIKNEIPNNINVINGFSIPNSGILTSLISYFSWYRISGKIGFDYDLIIVYIPSSGVVNYIKKSKNTNCVIVYDCVRNFHEWSGISKDVILSESNLVSISDFVFCDSFYLHDFINDKYNIKCTHLLPFSNVNIQPISTVNEIKKIGYFGTISEHIDLSVFKLLSDNGFFIEFWGIDESNVLDELDVNYKNNGYFSDLELLLYDIRSKCDALIIPYSGNMDGVFPAKLMHSLKIGLPVFTSSFYDSKILSDILFLYETKKELIAMLTNLDVNDIKERVSKGIEFSNENNFDKFKEKLIEKLISTN